MKIIHKNNFQYWKEDKNGNIIENKKINYQGYKVNDEIIVIDNSYNISVKTNKYYSIIGWSGGPKNYQGKIAKIIKTGINKIIDSDFGWKVNLSLMIEFSDGEQFYISPVCIMKKDDKFNQNFI